MLQIGSFSLNDFIQIFTDEEVSQLFICQTIWLSNFTFVIFKTIMFVTANIILCSKRVSFPRHRLEIF